MERDEEIPEWEKSKENVQPRKHGRCADILNSGLSARSEKDTLTKLKLEKEKYEAALRSYSGDDPLSVWYNYINWTEENFPKGGKTSHLKELLTSCVKQFEQSEKYKKDERYIQIWITFAGKCKEPCEVYKHMHSKKIGLQSAAFYKAWALATEDLGQTKMADKIFVQGLTVGAEPTDTLKRAREEFETRTCRNMIANMSTSDESNEELACQRRALVPLTSSSKGRAPCDRVSGARPNIVATHSTGELTSPQKPLQIFVDENDKGQHLPLQGQSLGQGQSSKQSVLPNAKENQLAAGKWNKSETLYRTSTSTVPSAQRCKESNFDVHEDATTAATSAKSTTLLGAGTGLSVKKAEKKGMRDDAPHLFTNQEQGDYYVQEVPMYDKAKVYAGVMEYSFEELHALKWHQEVEEKKKEQEAATLLQTQQARLQGETEQQMFKLTQLYKQFSHELSMEKVVVLDQLKVELREVVSKSVCELGEKLRDELNALKSNEARKAHDLESLEMRVDALQQQLSGLVHSSSAVIANTEQRLGASMSSKTPRGKCNSSQSSGSVSFKRHRTPDSSSAKRSLIKNSPLSVTQDCARLINGFFNQTLGAGAVTASSVPDEATCSVQDQQSNQFSIYTEQTEQHKSVHEPPAQEAPITIFTDAPSEAPVTVFTDAPSSEAPITIFTDAPSSEAPITVFTDAPSEAPVTIFTDAPFEDPPMEVTAAPSQVVSAMSPHTDAREPALASDQLPHYGAFEKPLSAFKRPENVLGSHSLQHKSVGNPFSVFTDPSSHKDFPGPDHASKSVRVLPHPNQENEPPKPPTLKSRLMSGSDSADLQTDMEIRANFNQASRIVSSTPFGNENQLSGPSISEIKQSEASAVPKRCSIAPIDFAPTQVLSPICEQSRESVSASRSTFSSDGSNQMGITNAVCSSSSNICLTKVTSDMMRTRCHGGSESDNAAATDSNSEASLAQSKSKARLSFHELDVVKEESGEILQKATPIIDSTFYQPPELTEAQLNTTVFIDPSNPFSESVQSKLLRKVDLSSYEEVEVLPDAMPKVKVGSKMTLSGLTLKIVSKIGQGGFASTYKATILQSEKSLQTSVTSEYSLTTSSQYIKSHPVCIKMQKPACPWELYICRELRERMQCMDDDLDRDILTRVMHIAPAVFYSDGSLMVNDFVPFGSLLNLVNLAKARRMMLHESLVMYITIELLHTIEVLHRCKIIHGDIKPDNVLFIGFPKVDEETPFATSSIKLIDYGRSIDISKFPAGTTFTANNETEGFICVEMKTDRPWTYQTDLFGVLGTVYTMLFASYMKVNYDSSNDKWTAGKVFGTARHSRYYSSKLWEKMFDEFLNIPSCDEIPDVSLWRERFEDEFAEMTRAYSCAAATINSLISSS
ncbi:mitotic checkpoint serine/threonine-protein kinase BUB1-like [Watersipora subatra]|uniref:mitotic checkpoint serine/threonine-protein kinase BUB1-like n=1 Tax=Watersipora subatra TaxID=2589382 RepID=UPI00355C780C